MAPLFRPVRPPLRRRAPEKPSVPSQPLPEPAPPPPTPPPQQQPLRLRSVAPSPVVARSVQTTIVPAGYGSTASGPSAGVVVGITLGAVGGFLLLMALLYACVNYDGRFSGRRSGFFFTGAGTGSVLEVETTTAGSSFLGSSRAGSRRHRHHQRRRRSGGHETVEMRMGTGGHSRRDRNRDSRRARPIIVDPPSVSGPGVERVTVVEEEGERVRRGARVESVDDDDEIVVEEEVETETDFDRRRRSRRRSRRHAAGDDIDDDEIVAIEEEDSPPPRRLQRDRQRSSRGDGPSRRDSGSRR